MLSDVYEWVADCWHDSHERHPGDASARNESSPWVIRAANRNYYLPASNWTERGGGSRSTGFRVAREVR